MVKPDSALAIKRHGFPLSLDAASFHRTGSQGKQPSRAAVTHAPRALESRVETYPNPTAQRHRLKDISMAAFS